LDFAVGERCSQ